MELAPPLLCRIRGHYYNHGSRGMVNVIINVISPLTVLTKLFLFLIAAHPLVELQFAQLEACHMQTMPIEHFCTLLELHGASFFLIFTLFASPCHP
jgi:hypothetical protein